MELPETNVHVIDGSQKKQRTKINFTKPQLLTLKATFANDPYPDEDVLARLKQTLGLSEKCVKKWYCNERTRVKNIRKNSLENLINGLSGFSKKQPFSVLTQTVEVPNEPMSEEINSSLSPSSAPSSESVAIAESSSPNDNANICEVKIVPGEHNYSLESFTASQNNLAVTPAATTNQITRVVPSDPAQETVEVANAIPTIVELNSIPGPSNWPSSTSVAIAESLPSNNANLSKIMIVPGEHDYSLPPVTASQNNPLMALAATIYQNPCSNLMQPNAPNQNLNANEGQHGFHHDQQLLRLLPNDVAKDIYFELRMEALAASTVVNSPLNYQ